MSTPVSGASYIIICDARIGIATASDEKGKIQAVSRGAAMLTAFMQTYYKNFKDSDCLNISALQHALMDHVNRKVVLTPEQVEAKLKAMVKEMYELEKRFA